MLGNMYPMKHMEKLITMYTGSNLFDDSKYDFYGFNDDLRDTIN